MKKKIIISLVVLTFATFFNIVTIFAEDIYDVVLMWGQSNMTGYAGLYDDEKKADPNKSNLKGIIESEIYNNYSSVSHVNVQLEKDTVYDFKYNYYLEEKNPLSLITSETKTIGEMLTYNSNKLNKKNGHLFPTTRTKFFSLQESYGTNIVPQFGKTYYEKTGHKLVVVMASNGGEEIANFLPHSMVDSDSRSDKEYQNQYIYEAAVEKYKAAVEYLQDNNKKIGNRFYVVFQGESDVKYYNKQTTYAKEYYNTFKKVHNNLKSKLNLDFGAIIETSHTPGIDRYKGVKAIHLAQQKLIQNNNDIVLATNYPYKNYVPSEYQKINDSELLYKPTDKNALKKSLYSMCNVGSNDNTIHFNAAALSQIGYESAISVSTAIKTSNTNNSTSNSVVKVTLKEIKGLGLNRNVENYNSVQSMTITKNHFVFVLTNLAVSGSDNVGANVGTDNLFYVVNKKDLSKVEQIHVTSCGHANGITYNPTTNELVCIDNEKNRFVVYNADNFGVVKIVNNGKEYWNISYDENNKKYYVALKNGQRIDIYNSDLSLNKNFVMNNKNNSYPSRIELDKNQLSFGVECNKSIYEKEGYANCTSSTKPYKYMPFRVNQATTYKNNYLYLVNHVTTGTVNSYKSVYKNVSLDSALLLSYKMGSNNVDSKGQIVVNDYVDRYDSTGKNRVTMWKEIEDVAFDGDKLYVLFQRQGAFQVFELMNSVKINGIMYK